MKYAMIYIYMYMNMIVQTRLETMLEVLDADSDLQKPGWTSW